ncbi:UDP-N-acetylglucosamine 1-carboxyvinyltransferase 1 [uncultured Clostridium sp.]|nr:UDP-N-acetylglucosamine 1-carboxyvinyltransferase 1 [uncultured Clostridium sp.]
MEVARIQSQFVMRAAGPLHGKVQIDSAKNAVLPLMAAALLAQGPVILEEVPDIRDVRNMAQVLRCYGATVQRDGRALRIETQKPCSGCEEVEKWSRELRASFLVAGPALARCGSARVPMPGGCNIGSRPVDLHLKGLAELGASVEQRHGIVTFTAEKLTGAEIHLDYPSVGATENILMAAVLAQGQTVIVNAATEPEVEDLAAFLRTMGAKIDGLGQDTLTITGVKALNGVRYTPIPDRIEAGTLMIATAVAGGDVTLQRVIPEHLSPVTAKLQQAGAQIDQQPGSIRVVMQGRPKAVDIKAMPHPGFPTDLQALICAMDAVAEGTGVVTETVFENRFTHLGELLRMGAQVQLEDRSAVITGTWPLSGTRVTAPDLRGGAALVLAGLVAQGETVVDGAEIIDRGYQGLELSLAALGADIHREALPQGTDGDAGVIMQ